jgi:hypothetical protein
MAVTVVPGTGVASAHFTQALADIAELPVGRLDGGDAVETYAPPEKEAAPLATLSGLATYEMPDGFAIVWKAATPSACAPER